MTAAHTHVFVGSHPEVLGDGSPLAIGAQCVPNLDDPHDAAMIARGWLVPVEPEPEEPKRQRRTPTEEKG